MKNIWLVIAVVAILTSCNQKQTESNKFDKESAVTKATEALVEKHGENDLMKKGLEQAASLWTAEDGTVDEFVEFCKDNFMANDTARLAFFEKASRNLEILYGNFNKMHVDLKYPVHVVGEELSPIDYLFGGYNASAHLTEDFYSNKIAFAIVLNFPFYSLEEKTELGKEWNRLDWAYARMGDMFTSRVPAEFIQNISQVTSNADAYISDYNIYMGYLVDEKGDTLFSKDKVLISHWGLRDELKSHYGKDALHKQRMVYEVMKRIIDQSIPNEVINSDEYTWNPISNKIFKGEKEEEFTSEDNVRYQWLLDNFKACQAVDAYSASYPTYIQRSFDEGREMSQEDVEKLFVDLCSSDQVKKVAALISERLGRPLEAFDIWYDGFKSRSSMSNEFLDSIVRTKYPNKNAFETDLPNILVDLGFDDRDALFIPSKIIVDASRGAGHAWGSAMKSDKARLRTKVEEKGMNYKG